MKTALLVILLSIAMPLQAAVYKCIVDGETIFSGQPCADSAEKISISPGYAPDQSNLNPGLSVDEGSLLDDYHRRIAIEKKQVMVGMSPNEVRRSWGNPDKINLSGGTYGSREQWIYRRGADAQYVYFEGGKVTSWN